MRLPNHQLLKAGYIDRMPREADPEEVSPRTERPSIQHLRGRRVRFVDPETFRIELGFCDGVRERDRTVCIHGDSGSHYRVPADGVTAV